MHCNKTFLLLPAASDKHHVRTARLVPAGSKNADVPHREGAYKAPSRLPLDAMSGAPA